MDALAFQEAGILRLVTRQMMKEGLEPNRLIHALQNHDEFNMSFNFMKLTPEQMYNYKGAQIPGNVLAQKIMQANIDFYTSNTFQYNTRNDSGVCSTILGMAAAALKIEDLFQMSQAQKEQLKKAHLLVSFYNAMQPGVFAISGWDLLGALPLSKKAAGPLIASDGDNRWFNRGAYDLLNQNPDVTDSITGIPRAQTLYPPLFIQLSDPTSYVSQLKTLLAAREKYDVTHAKIIAIPDVSPQLYVAIYQLPHSEDLLMVALNFGQTKHGETISSKEFIGKYALDMVTGKSEQKNQGAKGFNLLLDPLQAQAIVFSANPPKTDTENKEAAKGPKQE